MQKMFNRSDVSLHCLDASPYYENCVQQKCNHSDARATPFGHGPIQERISANLKSRLHSCPSDALSYRPDAARES
jgi:hypothetical protein